MKKHPEADTLAARLMAAANQPAGVTAATAATPTPEAVPEPAPSRRPKSKARQPKPKDDTEAISLRPGRALLNRYVLAAAERTRETGRVVSAQQIMLERLEGGP